jgi:hypothetical protein
LLALVLVVRFLVVVQPQPQRQLPQPLHHLSLLHQPPHQPDRVGN